MAEMNIESSGKKKGGKPAPKKMSTRIDFTPMVDLGFLLITFFMLTTTLIKPQTMEISMPSKKKMNNEELTQVGESRAITILLGKNNKVFYYFGKFEDNKVPEFVTTDFSPEGVRKMLLDRNAIVVRQIEELKQKREKDEMMDTTYKRLVIEAKKFKNAPVIMIKATDDATYKNLVDILDEMHICNIGSYTIMDIREYELEQIAKLQPTI